ncbi:beta-1,3-galactosyltransferase GALT1-like [Zingiber officinale]|uniref:Galectin domain-containing protein n=1 Tax=Zingiber officinale TaxID=94328 RepID=A0A8J5M0B6_ZINOF|nr:beta-1,3-galactosyltransferase GALT1-like [Zingiber officinale]KAG6539161.1 hypothetical protein ZIOFF_004314 [Zingiber officinale]
MVLKNWVAGLVLLFLLLSFHLRLRVVLKNPLIGRPLQIPVSVDSSVHLSWSYPRSSASVSIDLRNDTQIQPDDMLLSSLFSPRNLSSSETQCLQTWHYLDSLLNSSQALPNAIEASRGAVVAWQSLMDSVEEENSNGSGNGTAKLMEKEKLCPYSIRRMNASEFVDDGFKLVIPCGLTHGSSITMIGTPSGLLGNFQIELIGAGLPSELDPPPIILRYNVRLHGDEMTEDPVIVQNSWSAATDWGKEERCPSEDVQNNLRVDDLEQCPDMIGKDKVYKSNLYNFSRRSMGLIDVVEQRKYFPFRQGNLAIATIRMGLEGIQMTVDGKHITSFAYRERMEPWLVSEVRITGDIKLISVLASGLPTLEDFKHVKDLDIIKSQPIPLHKPVKLFIGVFSTANNFRHRMAVRRTWKQYEAIRSGSVAVQFFVGLHKNKMVNEQLWIEAHTYGDIQLMPFIDYYTLITWKTISICIYGTNIISAKYVMKTDDDSFVRVDELLTELEEEKATSGLLYGRINNDSQPHRNEDSKWYISPEEWPEENYPTWAHGPGYIVSSDIAKAVYKQYREGHLKMFKLEDVAMGIWIEDMKKGGMSIAYVDDRRIDSDGCANGYVVAHYQQPRQMLCLWQKLQETNQAICCS